MVSHGNKQTSSPQTSEKAAIAVDQIARSRGEHYGYNRLYNSNQLPKTTLVLSWTRTHAKFLPRKPISHFLFASFIPLLAAVLL